MNKFAFKTSNFRRLAYGRIDADFWKQKLILQYFEALLDCYTFPFEISAFALLGLEGETLEDPPRGLPDFQRSNVI